MQRLRKTTGGGRDESGNLGGGCGSCPGPLPGGSGERAGEKGGRAAWEGAGKLWTLLRSKLTRPEQQSVLADLETHPDDPNVQGAAICSTSSKKCWPRMRSLPARSPSCWRACRRRADKRQMSQATATSSARRIAAAASTSRAEHGRRGCRRIATADPELIVRFSRATGSDSMRSVGQREQ